jgi:hypothetical protein
MQSKLARNQLVAPFGNSGAPMVGDGSVLSNAVSRRNDTSGHCVPTTAAHRHAQDSANHVAVHHDFSHARFHRLSRAPRCCSRQLAAHGCKEHSGGVRPQVRNAYQSRPRWAGPRPLLHDPEQPADAVAALTGAPQPALARQLILQLAA